MTMYICKILPHWGLRIGCREGVGYEKSDLIIHSDTLFSGIISAYVKLYPDDSKCLEDLCREKKFFVVSSGFPYCRNVLFFPKPNKFFRVRNNGMEELELQKKLKKVEFVSLEILKKILTDQTIDITPNTIYDDICLVNEDEMMRTLSNVKFIVKSVSVARNVLDRITNLSSIFYVGETRVNTRCGCGYYFLIKPSEVFTAEKIKNALYLLSDEGLGGDRSIGKGAFKIQEFSEFELPQIGNIPELRQNLLLLSLYNPEKSEIERGVLNNASYEITTRGGWLYTSTNISWRKKQVRMFTEGSIFRRINPCPTGRVVDLTPDGFKEHKIFGNGLAFWYEF